ncbi:hypothetical protein ACFY4B_27450 [Kitasatospora sp. NPDC001261]|uniref:hypothetical protein n=1 Tax=Kitasatospora sp. NPDC001261 TaxID=3364012 RepID=UPI0036BC9C55
MGYTHYWSYTPQAEGFRAAWLQLQLDAAAIIDFVQRQDVQLAGGDGTGAPRIDDGAIRFNGRQADGDDYETFSIDLNPHRPREREESGFFWEFCKTGERPYDMAVTAVLLRAHTLAPDFFAIQSDGDWDSDWLEARAIHRILFGDPGMADPFTDTTQGPRAARTPVG